MSNDSKRGYEAQLLGAMLAAQRMAYPTAPFGAMVIGEKTVLGINQTQSLSPARLRHAASVLLRAADDLDAGKTDGRLIEETTPLLRENPRREDL